MSARQRREYGSRSAPTPANLKIWRAMRRMRNRTPPAPYAMIGKKHGVTASNIPYHIRQLERYEAGEAELKKNPTSISGLARTGRIPRRVGDGLLEHGTETLEQAAEWSRRELLFLSTVGKKAVDEFEAVMKEHGLSLHPDRPSPIHRRTRYQEEAERREEESAKKWGDRAFVIEQCRRVKGHLECAHHIMSRGDDDGEFRAALIELLRSVPSMINRLYSQNTRVREAAIQRTLTKWQDSPTRAALHEPAPEPPEYEGDNIIPFRLPQGGPFFSGEAG